MGNYPVTFETLLIAPNVCRAEKKKQGIDYPCSVGSCTPAVAMSS